MFFDVGIQRSAGDAQSGGTEQKTVSETEQAVLAAYDRSEAEEGVRLTKRQFRDKYVYRYISADDDTFNAFVQNLRSQRAGFNIGTDAALLMLNGASAVTGGAQTKAVLAAISGGLIGFHGSVDKELFNLEALSAISNKMKSARLTALVPIKRGLTKTDEEYPLEQALVDLRAYAAAGTLSGAVNAIQQDAGEEGTEAKQEIRAITRGTSYFDSLSPRNGIQARIKLLNDKQAIRMAFLMEGRLLGRSAADQQAIQQGNPSGSRFKSGQDARDFMIDWIEYEDSTAEQLREWTETLDIVEKG